ncbi:MAG: metallophosphoesterase [Candidatus Moranbacteria bacterium]|nr:metallophosphoesterase [Candidatus Moranbacteria bacterium]
MKTFLLRYQKKIVFSALALLLLALFGIGAFWVDSKTHPFSSKQQSIENTQVDSPSITPEIEILPSTPEAPEESMDAPTEELVEESTEETTLENEEGEEELATTEELEMLPPVTKTHGSDELRIGFLTDLHARSNAGIPESNRVIKPFFKNIITSFVTQMNNDFGADFLLLNGDVIEGTGRNATVGMGELKSLKKLFDLTQIKKYWVIGNHDVRAVNKKQWQQALEIDYLYDYFDKGDYRIIMLDSNFDDLDKNIAPGDYFTRGGVSQKQLQWLERALDTKKTKIVFMHHPPLKNIGIHPDSGLLYNAPELQEIFSKNEVTAVFFGHLEYSYQSEVNGVKYFMIPGATKNENYQGTFAEIKIKNQTIELTLNYLDKSGFYKSKKVFN